MQQKFTPRDKKVATTPEATKERRCKMRRWIKMVGGIYFVGNVKKRSWLVITA